jgi:hypothetical protein
MVGSHADHRSLWAPPLQTALANHDHVGQRPAGNDQMGTRPTGSPWLAVASNVATLLDEIDGSSFQTAVDELRTLDAASPPNRAVTGPFDRLVRASADGTGSPSHG